MRSFVSSTQYLSSEKVWNHTLGERQKPPGWQIFVAERDKLWEVDLRSRSARAVLEVPSVVSVAKLDTRKEIVELLASGGAAAAPSTKSSVSPIDQSTKEPGTVNSKTADKADAANADEAKLAAVQALRSVDRIVLYDSGSGHTKEFKLPASIPNKDVSVYWIAPDQLLVTFDSDYWSGGHVTQLKWIDGAGKVMRETEVKVAGYVPDSPQATSWFGLGIVPVTIVWVAGIALVAPLVLLQHHDAADFASAVAQCFHIGWAPFVLLIAISGLLAWLTLRLQRKYRRSHSAIWAGFVFLFGLSGFLAYLIEYRRAKLEACTECGEIVPRDREACADCDAEFALPPRVGTEIFA
jgi:hypothetical protein